MMYTSSRKVAFFDTASRQWDQELDLPALHKTLLKELKQFDIQPGEHIMDIGCGTGNLTLALLDVLGPEGSVTAIEMSMLMISRAQEKITDPRVRWQIADVARPMPYFHSNSVDRIMCYQVWPHLTQQEDMLKEFFRLLKPGGKLHIWHLDAREAINRIHAQSGCAEISRDVLPPAEETAALLKKAGLEVSEASESGSHYLVTASKPRAS